MGVEMSKIQIDLIPGIPFFVTWGQDRQGLYSYTFHYEYPIDGHWEEFYDVEETVLPLKDYVEVNKAQILKAFFIRLVYTLASVRGAYEKAQQFIQVAEELQKRAQRFIELAEKAQAEHD